MHRLRERLIGAREQDHELRLRLPQALGRGAVERALLVDRMDQGPMQGEEQHRAAFQGQRLELPDTPAVLVHHPAEGHPGLHLDELVPPLVDDPEHEARDPAVGGDDRPLAVEDVGEGPAEAGEREAGGEGHAEQADEGLDRDEAVGGRALGAQPAVADGGEGLHAEEERLQVPFPRRDRGRAVKRPRPAEQVRRREEQVHQHVRAEDDGVEHPQGGVEHLVVEVQRPQEGLVLAHDVEASVAVQEARVGTLKDPAAEAEVTVFRRHFEGCGGHGGSSMSERQQSSRIPPC